MRKIAVIVAIIIVSISSAANRTYVTTQEYMNNDSTARDTTVNIRTQDLDTIVVNAKKKELPVMDAIRQSLNNGMVQPRSKSLSDVLGKTSDYITNPFGFKQRKKEKMREKTKKNLEKLRPAKTYEDELREQIMLQLLEDSLNAVKK